MVCPHCNASVTGGSVYCSACGERLEPAGGEHEVSPTPGSPMDGVSMLDSLDEEGEEEEIPRVSRYHELEQVGKAGGMGVVHRAYDRRLGRIVALKRLKGGGPGAAKARQRFLTEARAIAALNHYNIVQIYDVGHDADGVFIVMEYIEGEDLRHATEQAGKLDPEQAIEITRQICNALSFAHARGVIHRDIKPSNILLDASGVPKLVDFGLAQIVSSEDLTTTGMIFGTPQYVSPEQRRDAKHVDHRTDVYSLGGTLYFMLTGRRPTVIRATDLPEELRPYVLKALEEDPDDRYATADEFGDALGDVRLGDVVVLARRAEERYHMGDLEGALRLYERVLSMDPGHSRAQRQIKEIKGEIDSVHRARQEANEAINRGIFEKARSAAKRALAIAPGDAEAARLLAKAEEEIRASKLAVAISEAHRHLSEGNLEAAEAHCDSALHVDPGNQEVAAIKKAISLAWRRRIHVTKVVARKALKEKRYTDAIVHLKQVLALTPATHQSRRGILDVLRFAEASESLRQARNALASGDLVAAGDALDAAQGTSLGHERLLAHVESLRTVLGEALEKRAQATKPRFRFALRKEAAWRIGIGAALLLVLGAVLLLLRPARPTAGRHEEDRPSEVSEHAETGGAIVRPVTQRTRQTAGPGDRQPESGSPTARKEEPPPLVSAQGRDGEGASPRPDFTAIVSGLRQVSAGADAFPGNLEIIRPRAAALVMGDDDCMPRDEAGRPPAVVAAGVRGEGRGVCFGHRGFWRAATMDRYDNARLIRNVLAWVGKGGKRVLFDAYSYDTHFGRNDYESLAASLTSHGYSFTVARRSLGADQLSQCDVFIVTEQGITSEEIAALQGFVGGGGGVIAAGLGWTWLLVEGVGNTGENYPLNHVAALFGIRFGTVCIRDPSNNLNQNENEPVFHRFWHKE